MDCFRGWMETVGTALDAVGVAVIAVGALIASGRYVLAQQGSHVRSYSVFRQDLGRAILLGLEFMVAGDIIRTVVVAPTMQNVAVLGVIVLIRTFLSMALQLEVDGRWPWQRAEGTAR